MNIKKDLSELDTNLAEEYSAIINGKEKGYESNLIYGEGRENMIKRINKKLEQVLLQESPDLKKIEEILHGNEVFSLPELPNGVSIKIWNNKELDTLITSDIRNSYLDEPTMGNEDISDRIKYFNIKDIREFYNHEEEHPKKIFITAQDGNKIIGVRSMWTSPYYENWIDSSFISIDANRKKKGLSKHLLFQSIKRANDNGFKLLKIGGVVKEEGQGYVLHTYKQLARMFPDIIIAYEDSRNYNHKNILTNEVIDIRKFS